MSNGVLREFEADLSAYLDDELPAERRAELEAALRASSELREELARLSSAQRAVAELATAAPSELLRARVRRAYERELAEKAPGRSGWRRAAPALAAAAAAALVWLVFGTEEEDGRRLETAARTPEPATSASPMALPEPATSASPMAPSDPASASPAPTLDPSTTAAAPPSAEVAQIEREFAEVLASESELTGAHETPTIERAGPEPSAVAVADEADRAIVEVLDFLETLGDLSESGRG